jgi:hypothetical protein
MEEHVVFRGEMRNEAKLRTLSRHAEILMIFTSARRVGALKRREGKYKISCVAIAIPTFIWELELLHRWVVEETFLSSKTKWK